MQKQIHIFGGGTTEHITSHLALSAPAYGQTARTLAVLCHEVFEHMDVQLHLTRMAGGKAESAGDVSAELAEVIANPLTKVIFFSTAVLDYKPHDLRMVTAGKIGGDSLTDFGKYSMRLKTRENPNAILEITARKSRLISKVREERKDIFLVAFKTTCGETENEMFLQGLRLCKEASANLVLVNDTSTRMNMIITPEEAAYHVTADRTAALYNLVEMAYFRSHLTFTQSTVVDGQPVPWDDDRVPAALRSVIDHCISGGAYKSFNGGGTVGHFAVKLSDNEFLTSIRRSNFNELGKVGLVYVKTDGPDTVLAYGAKPSVGGQSQRIVFNDHPGFDCIAHFHCPMREDHVDAIPIKSQREVECGSHQCGKQTSDGLKQFGNLKAVMLDNHGPNIVFNNSIDPREVIEFIERNFVLAEKTGGYTI